MVTFVDDLTVAQWLVSSMLLLDVIVAAAVIFGLSCFGSRPDAEQLSGVAVIAAVVGAVEFTVAMIAIDTLAPCVRVISSLAAFILAIFCASKNWRQPSLRTTLVVAIILIGILMVSIGRSTLNTPSSGTHAMMLLDALTSGADAVIQNLPFQDGAGLALDVAGWLVLAAFAFGFWRVVERRSAQQLPGPVTMELTVAKSPRMPRTNGNSASTNGAANGFVILSASGARPAASPDSGVGTDPDAQLAVFRAALLQNVVEPGAVPGAPALLPLTDLMELPIAATWLTPIASVIKNLFAIPTGYKVLGEVVPPDTNGGDWVVLARVIDVATGEQVDVATHRCTSDVHACRTAGYWAATVILGRSGRIASWSRWDKGTADALATYNNLAHSRPKALTDLKGAVAQAPSSGVLLMLLAAGHEFNGEPLPALSLYARGVAAHPRYPVARYRMTISVGMLARNTIDKWVDSTPADRDRIVGQLIRACQAMRVNPNAVGSLEVLPTADPVDRARASECFHSLATELLKVLRQDTNYWGVVARSFRRSERDGWWLAGLAKFGRSGPRHSSMSLVLSAGLLNEHTHSKRPKYEKKVLKWAARSDAQWELCYNIACYYAGKGQSGDALKWLETALERPNSGQMHREWIATDPDLKPISDECRFKWVLAQLGRIQGEQGWECTPQPPHGQNPATGSALAKTSATPLPSLG